MAVLLRILGAVWILFTCSSVWATGRRLVHHPASLHFGFIELVYALMFVGGIGLLLLREWGRWVLLAGAAILLLIKVGPSLMHLQLSQSVLQQLVFYGLMVAILVLPQSRAVTRK